jgi:hypothetical protein
VSLGAVCLFCGSSPGVRPEYAKAAHAFGQELARRAITLVYGGGNVGLMGIAADAAINSGGRVVGVIPRLLLEKEVGHRRLSELHVVETMHERKALMADLSDAFVTLPGGFGTLDETFEVLTWGQLGIMAKRVGLLNVAGMYTPLLGFLDALVTERFLLQENRDLLVVSERVDELLALLETPFETPPGKWLDRVVR